MNKFKVFYVLIIWVLSFAPKILVADEGKQYVTCDLDTQKQTIRSVELQKIVAADQDDRENNIMKSGAQFRDRERRQRVGSIFGEGCFLTASDFSAAALVYQHGDRPEHFMQAFLWFKRAVELGDASQNSMMIKGIDRYLVNIGHKQLFATQYFKPSLDPKDCWCLNQTEPTFPDDLRIKYQGQTYEVSLQYLKKINQGLSCPVKECEETLKPSPEGIVPGFW